MMIIDVEGKHDAYKVTSVPVTKTGDMLEGNDGVCVPRPGTWYHLAWHFSFNQPGHTTTCSASFLHSVQMNE